MLLRAARCAGCRSSAWRHRAAIRWRIAGARSPLPAQRTCAEDRPVPRCPWVSTMGAAAGPCGRLHSAPCSIPWRCAAGCSHRTCTYPCGAGEAGAATGPSAAACSARCTVRRNVNAVRSRSHRRRRSTARGAGDLAEVEVSGPCGTGCDVQRTDRQPRQASCSRGSGIACAALAADRLRIAWIQGGAAAGPSVAAYSARCIARST